MAGSRRPPAHVRPSREPLLVEDSRFREGNAIMARVALGLLVIVTLLSAHFTRRRLREWRS